MTNKVINREELKSIVNSAMSRFYKSGFTNTAESVFKLILSEFERLNSCKEQSMEFEKLEDSREDKRVRIEDELHYRKTEYFNNKSLYLFYDDFKYFISKVHEYNGYFYTDYAINYKANTVKCVLIENKY